MLVFNNHSNSLFGLFLLVLDNPKICIYLCCGNNYILKRFKVLALSYPNAALNKQMHVHFISRIHISFNMSGLAQSQVVFFVCFGCCNKSCFVSWGEQLTNTQLYMFIMNVFKIPILCRIREKLCGNKNHRKLHYDVNNPLGL